MPTLFAKVLKAKDPSLVEISQNVITPFTTTCNLYLFAIRFGNICNYKTKFQCPISCNSHQISCLLKILYNDMGVYFNVCTKIIYMYIVHIMSLKINI